MKEKIEALKAWIMANKLIAVIVGLVVVIFLLRKKLFRRRVNRRRSSIYNPVHTRRTRTRRTINKPGTKVKKPWQIKGSEAARRHMAKIRRMR